MSLTFNKPLAMELHKLFESCRSFQKNRCGMYFLEDWLKCGFVMHEGFPVLTFISFTTLSNSKNISFTSSNREVKIFFSHSIFFPDMVCILWSFEQYMKQTSIFRSFTDRSSTILLAYLAYRTSCHYMLWEVNTLFAFSI